MRLPLVDQHRMGTVSDAARPASRERATPDARRDDSLARSAFRRGARLASLPLGFAGRATLGLGKRLGGAPAEQVSEQMQQRAAEQLFRVLGELKGGAMKFGQALSLFESVLPEDIAAPYRAHLSRLQDAAPPMPTSRVHAVLARELGPRLAGLVRRLRARCRRPRPRSVRCIGRPGGRTLGGGEGAVPGCRRGAALRPEADRPAVQGDRAAGRRDGRQAAGRRADCPGQRGARLHAGGRGPAAGRRGLRRAPRSSSCRRCWPARRG